MDAYETGQREQVQKFQGKIPLDPERESLVSRRQEVFDKLPIWDRLYEAQGIEGLHKSNRYSKTSQELLFTNNNRIVDWVQLEEKRSWAGKSGNGWGWKRASVPLEQAKKIKEHGEINSLHTLYSEQGFREVAENKVSREKFWKRLLRAFLVKKKGKVQGPFFLLRYLEDNGLDSGDPSILEKTLDGDSSPGERRKIEKAYANSREGPAGIGEGEALETEENIGRQSGLWIEPSEAASARVVSSESRVNLVDDAEFCSEDVSRPPVIAAFFKNYAFGKPFGSLNPEQHGCLQLRFTKRISEKAVERQSIRIGFGGIVDDTPTDQLRLVCNAALPNLALDETEASHGQAHVEKEIDMKTLRGVMGNIVDYFRAYPYRRFTRNCYTFVKTMAERAGLPISYQATFPAQALAILSKQVLRQFSFGPSDQGQSADRPDNVFFSVGRGFKDVFIKNGMLTISLTPEEFKWQAMTKLAMSLGLSSLTVTPPQDLVMGIADVAGKIAQHKAFFSSNTVGSLFEEGKKDFASEQILNLQRQVKDLAVLSGKQYRWLTFYLLGVSNLFRMAREVFLYPRSFEIYNYWGSGKIPRWSKGMERLKELFYEKRVKKWKNSPKFRFAFEMREKEEPDHRLGDEHS